MNRKGYHVRVYRLITFLVGLLVLGLMIYSLVNYSYLHNSINAEFAEFVGKYGLLSVFILTFLVEISPQPFVSSIFPLLTGFILGLDPFYLFTFTILAVISSSLFAYYVGIHLGKKITIRIIGQDNYEKARSRFKRYGKAGMAILALTPIPYFPILAGLFKMDLVDFILYGVIPRIIHFIVLGSFLVWVF